MPLDATKGHGSISLMAFSQLPTSFRLTDLEKRTKRFQIINNTTTGTTFATSVPINVDL